MEIVRYAANYEALVKSSQDKKQNDDAINKTLERIKLASEGFFKNYDSRIDHEVVGLLMEIYCSAPDKDLMPAEVARVGAAYKGDFKKYADDLFAQSFMADEQKVNDFLKNYKPSKAKEIEKDPAYILAMSIYDLYRKTIYPKYVEYQDKADELYRVYMQGLMEMQPEKKFYPDANMTLRVAYGQVGGFNPRDAVRYEYFTTLKGVIEKEDSTIYDYTVNSKLKDLYNSKDYGMYADTDGSMHVAFVATNHTTGGNSGSPVLNADGHLIGINFDRVWEGTMSDIVFEPAMCRNISVDIRYCLFIIDKYAGAHRLIEEMTLVK